MIQRYKGDRISGNLPLGPPRTRYWESLGSVLKDSRLGSIVQVMRIQDRGIMFQYAGLAAF
jgi:hypothetical protein